MGSITPPWGIDDGPSPVSPEVLRRRARLCRAQARATPHRRLAQAFIELADAFDAAAVRSELVPDEPGVQH
jgi:hypothetical protein